MTSVLSRLSLAIEQGLSKQRAAVAVEELAPFRHLRRASADLEQRFEQAGPAPAPPREKRRLALHRFRASCQLNNTEWRLVFAGLADKEESLAPLLEDDLLFGRIHEEVRGRIQRQRLNRRDWLALCFSYFGYEAAQPETNPNWRLLREDIDQGFGAVRKLIGREKEWMHIVERYRELFTDKAGQRLGEQMFDGEIRDLSSLQTIAQIPESSWLWRRIFTVLLSRIFNLDDDEFVRRLPSLVSLGREHPRYLNDILSACLTRYHQSKYRQQSSTLLKQAALDSWGSPQLRSKQNSWLQYVETSVCAMVVAWFAKDDIEHFFSLLKGEAEVDQARLYYWLRFADQMSYTRIVMGGDAWNDRGHDFVEFRQKNKGRLSQLVGGPSHNNAVIMQIGSYFFVEFSGTGNACYVYKAEQAPFNPDKAQLSLSLELKQPGRAIARMSHSPAPRLPTRMEGWLCKFDDELRRLGVVPQQAVPTSTPRFEGSSGTGIAQPLRKSPAPGVASDALAFQVQSALGSADFHIYDHRQKGGVFQVKLGHDDAKAKAALLRLGFKPVNQNPLMFWRA